MTETHSASGAQTEKDVPSTPFDAARMGAQLFIELELRAFVKEINIVVGQSGDFLGSHHCALAVGHCCTSSSLNR